jgi:acyl carrier protein
MDEMDAGALYERLRRDGLDCDSDVRALTRLWRRGDDVLALVGAATDSPYVVDPVALDACLRAAAVLLGDGLWMAGSVDRLTVHGRPRGDVWCQASRLADDRIDLELRSRDGEPLVLLHGLRLELASAQALGAASWQRMRELSALLASDPGAARQSLLTSLLRDLAAHVAADVTADTRLNGIGLGSLQAVRLRNALARDYAADVPLSTLLGASTVEDLTDLICEQLAVRDLLATSEIGADDDVEVLSI